MAMETLAVGCHSCKAELTYYGAACDFGGPCDRIRIPATPFRPGASPRIARSAPRPLAANAEVSGPWLLARFRRQVSGMQNSAEFALSPSDGIRVRKLALRRAY
mmetsp:Transcript_97408/g.275461  ORF Transcript_97408/g.275461 Transcript_97408/m.275461 type:complete len:104 (-) Transcript_97408:37-348(-)